MGRRKKGEGTLTTMGVTQPTPGTTDPVLILELTERP